MKLKNSEMQQKQTIIKMKKQITNLIIVDASGSMEDKKQEVIGGMKQLFKQIKDDAKKDKKKAETRTIVVDFSSAGDLNVLVDTKDSSDLKEEVADNYSTRALTALYDAIGKGFGMIGKKQDGVFVSIITDGLENDSKEVTQQKVKDLIEKAKKSKWGITFMGTSEESVSSAVSLGVLKGNVMKFDNSKKGMKRSMESLKMSRSAYYSSTLSSDGPKVDNLIQTQEE